MKQRSILIFGFWLAAVVLGIYACSNSSNNPGSPILPTSGSPGQATATATPSNTFICPLTVTPTFTIVPGSNSVVAVVTYTGAGTVSASNVIAAYLTNAVGSGAITQLVQTSPTNGNTFTFNNLAAGNYYFGVIYDATSITYPAPSGGLSPHVGDYYAFYTGAGTTSGTPPNSGTAASGNIVVSGGTVNLGTVSFDGTNVFQGVSGTINYAGAKGAVDCRNLYIETFTNSSYTVPIGTTQVSFNNSYYDQMDLGTVTPGQIIYVQAWYDYTNTGVGGPFAGDPVTQFGMVTSPATSTNITLTDAHVH